MPRGCLICNGPHLEALNRDMARGLPFVEIAAKYGYHKQNVTRHRKHLGRDVALALLRDSRADTGLQVTERLNEIAGLAERCLAKLDLEVSMIDPKGKPRLQLIETGTKLMGEVRQSLMGLHRTVAEAGEQASELSKGLLDRARMAETMSDPDAAELVLTWLRRYYRRLGKDVQVVAILREEGEDGSQKLK